MTFFFEGILKLNSSTIVHKLTYSGSETQRCCSAGRYSTLYPVRSTCTGPTILL